MTETPAESLPSLVARLQARVNELRRAGELSALTAAARSAADEIEHRVGDGSSDEERQALTAVKRFTFNAAADCWPGWSVSDTPPDIQNLLAGQELARRSLALVRKLNLGAMQEATGIWLDGAFDLALGKHAEASNAFAAARELYLAAKAPGLALLTEGYIAIVRQITGGPPAQDIEDLNQVCAKITAGGFEDAAEWVDQLRTALRAFTSQR